jgi:hypothetical protein
VSSGQAIVEQTLMSEAVRVVGPRQAWKACLYVASWGVATEEAGHPVSADEYAVYWKESDSKVHQQSKAFRRAFRESSPERLWGQVRNRCASPTDIASAVEAVSASPWDELPVKPQRRRLWPYLATWKQPGWLRSLGAR